MHYLKFISSNGVERGVSCYSYTAELRDDYYFITAYSEGGTRCDFVMEYCVGKKQEYCAVFIMNINGKTIAKYDFT